jgi:hypothetical protein
MYIAIFPVMLYLYRRVTNSLVDLGKQQANVTLGSVIATSGEWYIYFISYLLHFLYKYFIVLLYRIM